MRRRCWLEYLCTFAISLYRSSRWKWCSFLLIRNSGVCSNFRYTINAFYSGKRQIINYDNSFMRARHGMEASLYYPDSPSYHDSILANVLIFSKLSQNVMDQGAILSQQGTKPL